MRPLIYLLFSIILLTNYSCKDLGEDFCENTVCLNGGFCNTGNCECPDGFRGEFCENKILLLKTFHKNGILDESYEYNSDNSLSRILVYDSDGEAHRIYIYNYYTDSLIINAKDIENGVILDEDIKSEKFFKLGGDTINLQKYTFGNLATSTFITSFDPDCGYEKIQGNSTATYEYTDENCSYNRENRVTANNIFLGSSTVTLDDKNAYNESIKIAYYGKENSGNPLRSFLTNSDGTVMEGQNQFEYNESDYPISGISTIIFDDGDVLISNYTYEYYD